MRLDFVAGTLWGIFCYWSADRGWYSNLRCRIGWHAAPEFHTLTERNNEDHSAFAYSVAEMERCPRCGRRKILLWYDQESSTEPQRSRPASRERAPHR